MWLKFHDWGFNNFWYKRTDSFSSIWGITSGKRLLHLASTLTLSLLMLSDSELFKRTSHIHVAALSRTVHIKNTPVRLLGPARSKSLKLTLERLFLAIPPLESNRSVLYTCVYTYVHPITVYIRTRIYLHYVHSCFSWDQSFAHPSRRRCIRIPSSRQNYAMMFLRATDFPNL